MDRHQFDQIQAAKLALRMLRARLNIRSMIRLTFDNRYWLEDTEGEQLGDNVNKNIAILTRKKHEEFSLQEKAIMRVPQKERTESEKRDLQKVLGVMRCFRKYPIEIKNELPAITYFAEFGPERLIVRQGDQAMSLYFVICGTASVVLKQLDPVTNTVVEDTLETKGPGDLFGELALIIDSKRSASIITNERCEFLVVYREDFDRVLKSTVQQEWNEIKEAMQKFNYFNAWSPRSIIQSCMLSKIIQFDENNLILSENVGEKRYVYFLIEGTIDLIECLEIKVSTFRNKTTYELYTKDGSDSTVRTANLSKMFKNLEAINLSDLKFRLSYFESKDSIKSTELKDFISRIAIKQEDARRSYIDFINHLTGKERVEGVRRLESFFARQSVFKEVPVTQIENHFMRVATMSTLSTFNISERLKNRFYVSKSKVKLMLIPRYWLLSRDRAIWNNIEIFLNKRLPTRKQLFQQYLQRQRWIAYRKKCYFNIADKMKSFNYNCINNVPISIRMEEDLDYFYSQTREILKMKPLPDDED